MKAMTRKKSGKKSDGAKRLEAAAERVEKWVDQKEGRTKSDSINEPPRCPKCNSTQVHVRVRDGAIVCHRCGEVTEMERRKKEVL